MKTVQMTLDEELLAAVDEAVRRLGTTRSAFTREALTEALARLQRSARERQHRRGYERHPVGPADLEAWEAEQVWPD